MPRDWLFIAFSSTTAALQMEKAANAHNLPGKLVPIPRQLSATCGLAFRSEPAQKAALAALIQECNIETEGFHILAL